MRSADPCTFSIFKLHLPNALTALREGISIADYVSLYDHPDKYVTAGFTNSRGTPGGHHTQHGGEMSHIRLTKSAHWKSTTSTTMTFGARVETLIQDHQAFKQFCAESYTDDFRLFTFLTNRANRTLATPLPGFATHGETRQLAPIAAWAEIAAASDSAWWDRQLELLNKLHSSS